MEIGDVKGYLEQLDQRNISFDSHFYKRSGQRPIDESIVRSFLSHLNKLEKIEQGKSENRFKLWFKMSSKYFLVLIIEIILSKDLKVISAWNSNRKWQKKIKRFS